MTAPPVLERPAEPPVEPSSSRHRLIRSRWAAIGAAVAVSLGAGGIALTSAASTPTSGFVPITPARILDTRSNIGLPGTFSSPSSRTLQVTGSVPTPGGPSIVVPAGATAVTLNVTAVNPQASGFISVRPDGTPGAPTTSNLNVDAGTTIPNSVTVALPAGGAIDITYDAYGITGPTTHVLVDVAGYFLGSPPAPPSPVIVSGGFATGTLFTTTSLTWGNVGTAQISIPPGQQYRIVVSVTAETGCRADSPDQNSWCAGRVLLDGIEMLPRGLFARATAIDHATSTDFHYRSHALIRHSDGLVGEGTHTITLQGAVNQANMSLWVDDWVILVEAFPG